MVAADQDNARSSVSEISAASELGLDSAKSLSKASKLHFIKKIS